jgi:hypothetical protein
MKHPQLFIACAVAFMAMVQIAPAAPVTGTIQFVGVVQLDSANDNTATVALKWTNTVSGVGGVFTNIAYTTAVTFSPLAWHFNSGPVTGFWSVGGFTCNLTSSSVIFDSGGFLDVIFTGTISGNGFDPTPCNGTFYSNGFKLGPNCVDSQLSFTAIPAPPNLSIAPRAINCLKILWPTNSIYNYTLQQNPNPATTNWVTTSWPITNCFGTNFCTVAPPAGNMFFRLSE